MAFRSFAILSALASAAFAQNPFIPSGISDSCSKYLTSLNNDAGFTACTSPFTTAFAAFTPGNTSTPPSSATISSALTSLCQSNLSTTCPQSTVTTQLSSFYANCQQELTSASPNPNVKTTYDVLYSLIPLRQVLCAKDDSGNFCATKLSNASGIGSAAFVDLAASQKQSLLSQYLYTSPDTSSPARRDLPNLTTALIPNVTTYRNTNLVFLFLSPDLPSAQLCVTCTRNIMTPYITFETNSPYALGLNSSLLFSGQIPLYNSVVSKCGANFLNGAVQAAGGISSSVISGAAPLAVGQEFSTAISAILGLALVAASL